MLRSTHTYAVLEISQAAWDEIAGKLRAAGYNHVFDKDRKVIDGNGIGFAAAAEASYAPGDFDRAVDLLRRLSTPGESHQARYDAAVFMRRIDAKP